MLIKKLNTYLLALLVGSIGLWVYLPTLSFPFQYDDFPNIVFNRALRYLHEPSLLLAGSQQQLRIVTNLSFALNYEWSGLSPNWFRLVNVSLHFVNGALLFLVARRVLQFDTVLALFAATLFLLHPLAAESVVYVNGRSVLLVSAFSLGALLCYAKSGQGYVGIVFFHIFTILAIFSKESGLVLPIMAMYFSFYWRWSWRWTAVQLIPYAFLALVFLIVKFPYAKTMLSGALFTDENFAIGSFSESMLLQLSIWPKILAFFTRISTFSVEHALALPAGWWDKNVLIGLGIWIGFICSIVGFFRGRHRGLMMLSFFFIGLLPTNSLILLPDPLAERHVYFAIPWFALALAHGLGRLELAKINLAACFVLAFLLGWLGKESALRWSSTYMLWVSASENYPQSGKALYNAAAALFYEEDRPEEAWQMVSDFWLSAHYGELSWEQENALLNLSGQLVHVLYKKDREKARKSLEAAWEESPASRFWFELVYLKYLQAANAHKQVVEASSELELINWFEFSLGRVATRRSGFFLANLWAIEGESHFAMEAYREAEVVWRQIFSSGQLEADFFLSLRKEWGRALVALGDFAAANAVWQQFYVSELRWKRVSLDWTPEFVELLLKQGLKDEAERVLARALRFSLDDPKLLALKQSYFLSQNPWHPVQSNVKDTIRQSW